MRALEDGLEGAFLLDLDLVDLFLPPHQLPLPLLQLEQAGVQLHVQVVGTLELAFIVLPDVLSMPVVKRKNDGYQYCAFATAAPILWNKLPDKFKGTG